ncbi:metal-sulfur cluster assembly factor [Sphingobacterium olei]|uniref:Metal-sulfur cluster assembly factor n=1 Tax=Sphingobacterium olei TaxID=2571155 RepID=A0A4V5MLV4_9SPHI|nr:metal-sulfur cluster assembly factor [Sphingobacterium olei]TJZ54808.1 metal-sulfur cluster assembly factor [Sphingobacterium olei]
MNITLNNPYAKEQLKAQVTLMQVIDPELGVNIIDLGLVYAVNFSSTAVIHIDMTFSTSHCPLGDAIKQGVMHALTSAFPDHKININIVWDPEWNYDMISEAGKQQLGLD